MYPTMVYMIHYYFDTRFISRKPCTFGIGRLIMLTWDRISSSSRHLNTCDHGRSLRYVSFHSVYCQHPNVSDFGNQAHVPGFLRCRPLAGHEFIASSVTLWYVTWVDECDFPGKTSTAIVHHCSGWPYLKHENSAATVFACLLTIRSS